MNGISTRARPALLVVMTTVLGLGCDFEVADYPSQAELYDKPTPEYKVEHRQYEGFVLATPSGDSFMAKVGDEGIIGYDMFLGRKVNVGRYRDGTDRALRGHAFGQWLDLKVEKGRVHGIFNGMSPLDITTTREGDALRVKGLVRGYDADFVVADKRMVGSFGRCTYDVAGEGGAIYEGVTSCLGRKQKVLIKLPKELSRWSDAEQGAALGLLLGGR
ncbi:hypothetical protein [Chondromyces crocatus]|uniref:Lipoprotein n=1 Tax=Chondromyces crocatus TaxID=52 RepID=A0A0K1ERC1_CHOCO|nr:hypothetical protein [Chondromyces crocatus]AKT43153.1 uncharacterized protein CMC5_073830 [Chondromyces crocatus]